MGCLFLLAALLSPRLAIILLWVFTNYIGRAFDGFLIPLIGLLVLPWTTLMYALVAAPAGDVSFFGWVFVALGVIADLASYGRAATSQPGSGSSPQA